MPAFVQPIYRFCGRCSTMIKSMSIVIKESVYVKVGMRHLTIHFLSLLRPIPAQTGKSPVVQSFPICSYGKLRTVRYPANPCTSQESMAADLIHSALLFYVLIYYSGSIWFTTFYLGTGKANWEWDEQPGSKSLSPVKVSSLLCRTLLKDFNWTHAFQPLCEHTTDRIYLNWPGWLCFNIPYAISVLSSATKADGFALYFLGESNNVSADGIYWLHCVQSCIYRLAFDVSIVHLCFSHLCISIELVFVHPNGGQGWPSVPHPLRSHRIWDNHCRSRCQDSQNATSGRHCRGKTKITKL